MRPKLRSVKPVCARVLRAATTLLGNLRGATAVEYGLILALVVLGMMTGLVVLADSTSSLWNMLHTRVAAAR